jgi:hypothetical protein
MRLSADPVSTYAFDDSKRYNMGSIRAVARGLITFVAAPTEG